MYFVTFCVVLPVLCRNLVHSSFYWGGSEKALAEQVLQLNAARVSQAENSLQNVSAFRKSIYSGSDVDIAVGIVTVPRQVPGLKLRYLSQTFVRMHEGVLSYEGDKFHRRALFVCNVHAGPGNHSEALDLESHVLVRNKFPKNDPATVIMDRFEKEKSDYAYCLDVALASHRPKYVLIVEDDVLPVTDLLDVLEVVLETLVEKRQTTGLEWTTALNWAYLKLYYPEKWQGYEWESAAMLELCGIALIGGSVWLGLGQLLRSRPLSRGRGRWFFAAGFLHASLIALAVGRQCVMEWRRVSRSTYTVVPAPDCCSPAILYPAASARQLSAYLGEVRCSAAFPLDYALEQFARKHGGVKYLVQPNLVKHIGFMSSLKTRLERPQDFL